VTLTATVKAGASAIAAGQVNFCDATAQYCTDIHILGTAQLTSAGTAVYRFIPGIGAHSYRAVFVGTSNNATSTSATLPLTVTGPPPSVTTIAQSGSPGNYSLTATVAGLGSVAPTGTVSFLDSSNGNAALGTASLTAGTAGLTLLNTANPPMGSAYNEDSVAIGDFNGDGIPDLDLAYGGVFLGNGDGTFTEGGNATGETVAVGDFNGDGALDLVTVNEDPVNEGHTVTVLLGNGDGTFMTAPSTEVSGYEVSWCVAVADFNRDGLPDVAVNNDIENSVTVLLSNGDGTFKAAASPAIGTAPACLVAGDFNEDGNPDLVTASGTVLLGNGDGTFAIEPATLPTGSIVAADFNLDGILDLASTSGTVLLGNGDGTFKTAGTFPGANSLAVGDFNGDGIPDLAESLCCNPSPYGPGSVTVLLGDGKGNFAPATTLTTDNGAFYMASADFNGDGIADLAVAISSVHGVTPVTSILLTENQIATATATAISPLGTGTHQVIASYPGDSNFKSSVSASTGLTAQQITPSATLVASTTSVAAGAPVTLTATISSGTTSQAGSAYPRRNAVSSPPAPTGLVTFLNNSAAMGASPLNGDGVATYTTKGLAAGNDSITASYAGDANYAQVVSPAILVSVSGTLSPLVTVTPSSSSITTTQPLTVKIAVNGGPGNPTSTGTVTLSGGGYTSSATTLVVGGATIQIPAGSLAVGSDTLTASYTPDTASSGIYTTATQSATVTVTIVGTGASTVTVSSAASTITDQQSLVITVSVAGSSGQPTPTGTVTLASGPYSQQNSLSSGTASFTIPAGTLSAGTNTLTATYSGDAVYGIASGTAMVTVSEVVITVPAAPPVAAGATSVTTATIATGSTYSGTIGLTCSLTSSPAGAESLPTCSLSPASVMIISGASATTVATVHTIAATTSADVRPSERSPWQLGGELVLAGVLMLRISSRRRRWMWMQALLWVVIAAETMGCGGGGSSMQTTSTPGTTAGSYTFAVTGTDTANAKITSSANFSVTVQ
jgi:hypothetical protein